MSLFVYFVSFRTLSPLARCCWVSGVGGRRLCVLRHSHTHARTHATFRLFSQGRERGFYGTLVLDPNIWLRCLCGRGTIKRVPPKADPPLKKRNDAGLAASTTLGGHDRVLPPPNLQTLYSEQTKRTGSHRCLFRIVLLLLLFVERASKRGKHPPQPQTEN